MNVTQILPFLKYFKGEERNPFIRISPNSALWWDGEKSLVDALAENPSFWGVLINSFNEAVANGDCSGVLIDETIAYEKRLIIFYLDLWHGRYFPYDTKDAICNY